jgi:hypothetical protein
MPMKGSNDTNGNQTCDLPSCSAVPQRTALLCYIQYDTHITFRSFLQLCAPGTGIVWCVVTLL